MMMMQQMMMGGMQMPGMGGMMPGMNGFVPGFNFTPGAGFEQEEHRAGQAEQRTDQQVGKDDGDNSGHEGDELVLALGIELAE